MILKNILRKNEKRVSKYYGKALSNVEPVFTPYVNRDDNGVNVLKVGEAIKKAKIYPCKLKKKVDYYG